MPDMVQVRRAEVADARAIAHVHVATWRTTYTGILPSEYIAALNVERREEFWREILTSPLERTVTLVATEGPQDIAGFVSGGAERTGKLGCDGELYAIYVVESAQRKGLGERLVREFMQELRLLDFHSMALWTLERNRFRGFYEKLGGRIIGEQTIPFAGQDFREVAYGWDSLAVP